MYPYFYVENQLVREKKLVILCFSKTKLEGKIRELTRFLFDCNCFWFC